MDNREAENSESCRIFRRLQDVVEVIKERNSILAADSILNEVARKYDQYPDLDSMKAAIIRLLDSGEHSGVIESLQYLGWRFRWQWLREEFESRRLEWSRSGDLRKVRAYELILEAFDGDWEDRDCFPSLSL
ncbi:hypothetical protein [Saccharopolyspora shandongensis]|uniref:hypothetical protein n=1 Tax=Saccharopolyspora shandongensis TaxID=418495 RepID=UPI0011600AAD|nr:hypothetical protein [Saccharopolyspora shandongensis]